VNSWEDDLFEIGIFERSLRDVCFVLLMLAVMFAGFTVSWFLG
jgi:hypothetical protein